MDKDTDKQSKRHKRFIVLDTTSVLVGRVVGLSVSKLNSNELVQIRSDLGKRNFYGVGWKLWL